MDYRQGTCGSCKSSFRVPASFTANKAKCPKCGGVVELGPAQSTSAAPAAEKPRPVPATVPAPRAAAPAAGAAKPAAAPVSKPAVAPAAAKPVASAATRPAAPAAPRAPSGKPVAPAGKETVRAAAEAAAQRVRTGGAAVAKAEPAAGEPKRRERLGRERPVVKKKSWGPTIGAAAFLLVLIVGAGWYFLKGSDDTAGGAQASSTPTAVAATQPVAPVAPEPEQPLEAAPVEEAPAVEEAKPAEKPPEKELVDDLDLSTFETQAKLAETSDADWAQIVEWADSFTDPMAGAAGNRARAKLAAKGKEAFPALLNEFKQVDLYTEEGYRTGDLIQKLLMEICHGNNFGWAYSTELKDVIYNKKAIRLWFVSWEQARDNEQAWRKLAKLDQVKPDEGETPPKKDELDDF
jgi:hypothetical protein